MSGLECDWASCARQGKDTAAKSVSRSPTRTSRSVTTPSSTFLQPTPESVEMKSPPSVAA